MWEYFSRWRFITTACAEAKWLSEDCYGLETLSALRDGYIRTRAKVEALIAQYCEITPKIVARSKHSPMLRRFCPVSMKRLLNR